MAGYPGDHYARVVRGLEDLIMEKMLNDYFGDHGVRKIIVERLDVELVALILMFSDGSELCVQAPALDVSGFDNDGALLFAEYIR